MTATPSHIVVVSLENEDYSAIVGNTADAPFLNQLISEGMLFTNYDGLTHPSQANYIALFSGSTQGVTNNGAISQFPASVPTLASALAAKGLTFGGYAETTADPERQPWIHFANSAADAHSMSAFPQTAAGFANLPTVSFVTPNDADNMTPTSDNGGGVPAGDAWVQANLGAYAAWAQANNSLLIITFDENNTNPAVTYPDHIATIVVGAGVPAGVTNSSQADTYSLLNTIQSLYGLTPVGVSAGAPPLDFYSSTTAAAPSTITDPFSGLSDPTNTPPQNALAVGPGFIVTAETTHYEVTDLSGNPVLSNTSLYSLFSPLGSTLDNSLLDARAAYDSATGRFVLSADNFQPGGGNFGSNIDVAVSKDSNPADGWYIGSIDTSLGGTAQSDMPYLSVGGGNIYITAPEFANGPLVGTGEWVVSENSVISGSTQVAASNTTPATDAIMRGVAGANGTTYYLSAYSDGRETALTYQTYDPTNGFSATQTLYLGDSDVGGGGTDYTAAQLGTTKTIDIGDSRIQSLAYASSGGHNYIYGVSEAMPSAGSLAQIEWFKLDVTDPANPQYVNGNVITGASIGANVAVFNPSIAVDQNGDVLINFSASGPSMYPADYYTVLGAGYSAFSAPTLYEASNTYLDSGSLNDQRWGTYSTTIADPNNANGFWFSNEYMTNTVNGPGGLPGWWDTIVAQAQVGAVVAPPVVSGAGNTVVYTEGGAPVTVDSGLTVSDSSSATLDSATVAVGAGLLAGDTLAFTPQSGITGTYNASTGVLTLSGNANLAAYRAALDSVVYSSTSADATNGGADTTRTITWTATSAGTNSAPATTLVNIVPPPPPPLTASVTAQFSGISDPTNYPPENALAVGPANVLMAETTHYEFTNLSGGAATTGSLYTLFTSLGLTLDNSLLDARAAYDGSTGRYVLIAENFQPGGGSFRTNIDIAVSKDSNPADGWYVASIDTSNSGTAQQDMPYLSVSGGNIVLSGPEYLNAGGFGGAGEWVLSESSVAAGALNTVANLAPAASYIMRGAAGVNGLSYYVGAHSTGSQTNLSYQTYSASGGFSAVQTIALGNSDLGPGASDFSTQQLGTTLTLDAGDSRIESLVYANGYLWGVSEVKPSGSTTPEIHWFKLDVSNPASPKVAAQGDISGAAIGSNVGMCNASLAVDGAGDVLINCTASGPSLNPSDYYALMSAGGSSFGAPTLYQASASYFQQTANASGAQRWGAYSSAIADPNNANGFWISNEYVTKTGVTIPTGLTAWWSTVTAQVTVSHSTSPTLGGAGNTVSYTEGGAAATLDAGLTVSDPSSSTLSGATVSIASGFLSGDALNFANQNGISGSYNASTGVLSLTGTASLAAYQTALESVSFSSTNLNPTNYGADLTRTINWQVSAGAAQSAVVSSSLSIVGVDQAPVLTGAGNTTTYAPGGAAVVIDNALAVSDPDNLQLASATVTISGNFQTGDTLSFTNQNGIVGSYSSATGVLTLTGTATLAQYQAALDAVTFSATSASAASRTISWQVSDGTLKSAAATSTVNVTTVSPTLGGAGNTVSYTEGGAAATLDAGLTVSDPSSSTLSGATVSIASGFLSGDALNFANQNGISGSYNASTGVLSLTGTASLAAYQTALESVSFSSTNLNPTNYGADLTRTINWQVSAGAAQSAVVSSSLSIVGVDQAPVLTGAGNTTTYAPGGAAVVIDNALAVSDPDNLQLASATVTISGNFQTGDTLSFTNQNGIVGSYSSATGVLTLTGTATLAQYQAALDAVTFSATSASAASRTISWQVSDGTLKSAAATSTVNVTTVSPTLGGAGNTVSYTEGGAAATLDAGLTVSDPSSSTLSGATVSIASGFLSGDALNFANQNGISGSYNASTGVLSLTGTASLAAYQTALESVSFSSTNLNPTNYGADLTRTINWQVSAGAAQSAVVSSSLSIVGVDQAPVLTGAGNTTTYAPGGAAVVIDNALAVSDPDNLQLASATVTISGNFQTGDTLSFTNQNGIVGSYSATTGVLTLTGTATLAQYQAALDAVTFSATSASAASRTISWQVSDGTLKSAAATSTVNVTTVSPTLGGAGNTVSYTEGGAAATLDAGLTVSDPSSSTLSGATVSIASGFLSGDALNFANQNGISGSYNASTGVLSLTGTASLAAYQTALESVSFSSTNLNPTNYGADLTRTINWQVSAGAAQSAVVSSSLSIVGVDQAPVLTGAGNTTTYAPGGAAVVIDNALAVSDPDNLQLASATVTISGNFQTGDTLSFTNQNGIVGSYSATTGVLTLTGTATLAQYQAALDAVTFSATSASAASRTISWQVSDGTLKSAAATSTVNLASQLAAPTFTSPTNGQTVTTGKPTVTGTGVAGDTVTLNEGATVLSSSIVVASNGTWGYTPTAPFANGALTLTATQAVAGGPSSAAATDSFTVKATGGLTISTAQTGNVNLVAANNPLTIASTGSVTTSSGDAIDGKSGTAWNIIDFGKISGVVGSSSAGVYLQGAGSTVQNFGTILGATAGVWLSSGGNVTNFSGGVISATGNYGVYVGGGAGIVVNAGTITGPNYAVDFVTNSSANRLIVDPGAIFNGAVNGDGGGLELSGGTGSIGSIGSGSFSGFSQLIVDAGGSWTLTGSNTIANTQDNGNLVIAGSLKISAAVNSASAGQFGILSGATLEVASDQATNSQIDFLGAGQLTIDNAASFGVNVGQTTYSGPLIEGFGAGDIMDIHGLSPTAAQLLYNPTNGMLQITNGSGQVATMDFQNSTLGTGTFSFASDGSSGLKITHS